MRIHVTFIDRIGITQEVLALLVARNLNLDAVEMVPPNVYIDAPAIDADVLDELRQALRGVRGVQDIQVVDMLPGQQRRLQLDALLQAAQVGELTGGGTAMSDLGEVEYGDIEVALIDASGVPKLIDLLEQLGAPKGSQLQGAGEADRSFGVTEGLGIYLDGLNLPDDVYEQCDSNHVFEQLSENIDGLGEICSWWQGPTETALYMYGESFEAMRDAIAEFVASYPLCQNARVVQIA